jgi:hypothetical protein
MGGTDSSFANPEPPTTPTGDLTTPTREGQKEDIAVIIR